MPIRFFQNRACACIGAVLSLWALSACLDDSASAPATLPPAVGASPVPAVCGTMGAQALLDSSLQAWRRLQGTFPGAYAYSRVRASLADSSLDSTRVVFADGRVAAREIWATILERPALLYARIDSQGGVVAESLPSARPYRFHACETTDVGGFHYLGDRAAPFESLYAECAAIIRDDPTGARVEVDADFLLKECAPGTEACRPGKSVCPDEVKIGGVEWRPPVPMCLQ